MIVASQPLHEHLVQTWYNGKVSAGALDRRKARLPERTILVHLPTLPHYWLPHSSPLQLPSAFSLIPAVHSNGAASVRFSPRLPDAQRSARPLGPITGHSFHSGFRELARCFQMSGSLLGSDQRYIDIADLFTAA